MWPSVLMADGAFEVVLTKSLASVLWIASGFLVSRLLDRFLWNGLLTREGQPIVAKVLSDLCSAAVYLSAACALFHFRRLLASAVAG